MKAILFIFLIFLATSGYTQRLYKIQGKVIDRTTKIPLSYASIYSSDKKIFCRSNSSGEFVINGELPIELKIRKFAFNDTIVTFTQSDTVSLIYLKPCSFYDKSKRYNFNLQNAELLKRAVEKIKGNIRSEKENSSSELGYWNISSMNDSSLNDYFEGFGRIMVTDHSLNSFQSEICRYAGDESFIKEISTNSLEFDIENFIKIPMLAEKYIKSMGFFDCNGEKHTLFSISSGYMKTTYCINIPDTSIVYLKREQTSGKRYKVKTESGLWKKNPVSCIEVYLEHSDNNKDYHINLICIDEESKLKVRKEPYQTINKNTFFSILPDSSGISNVINKYKSNELSVKPSLPLSTPSGYLLTGQKSTFDNELLKLLSKPYMADFWETEAILYPRPHINNRLKEWEENNQFYSENFRKADQTTKDIKTLINDINNNSPGLESVYIETDRPDYLAGDTIWFTAFVIDHETLDTTSKSRILYVDLINPDNKLEKQIKLLIKNGRTHGDFLVDKELKSGLFRLRAYTKWMRNFQEDFLFEKEIPVYETKVKGLINIDPFINHTSHGDSVNLVMQAFLPSKYRSIEKLFNIQVKLNDSLSVFKTYNFKDNFRGSLGFFVPDSLSCSYATMIFRVSDTALILEQRMSLPLNPGLSIEFFPESGKMIAGITSYIAYKAKDLKGNPCEFEADILNSGKQVVTHISGNATGIGKFSFTPKAGESYQVVSEKNGKKYLFDLPVVEPLGYVLSYQQDSSFIFITNNAASDNSEHFLFISVRGTIYTAAKMRLTKGKTAVMIPFNSYPKGIIQVTLYDNFYRPIAERLIFNDPGKNKMKIVVSADQVSYNHNEKVNLKIHVTDDKGQPVESSLSISVVEDLKTDSSKSDIRSYFLLTSELKGEIDHKIFDLSDTTIEGRRKIDLLMMTQGWRNYLWNSIRYSNQLLYPVEKGFYIDGIISKNTKETLINIIDLKSGASDIVQINKNRFTCDLPLFYDKHVFLIQSKYKKDKVADCDILLDTASIPEIKYRNNESYLSYRPGYMKALNEIFKNDSIPEPSIKYTPIPEVVVKARLRPWYSKPDKVINLEKIDPTGKKYGSLLQMIEEEFGEKAFIEGVDSIGQLKMYPPILVVNGSPMTDMYCAPCHSLQYGWAVSIPVKEISNVKFYEAGSDYSQFLTPPKPPPAGGGAIRDADPVPEGGNIPPPKNEYAVTLPEHRMLPVVSFTTYYNSFRGTPAGMIVFPFQGIYKAKEFYHPDKDNSGNNKVENRSTIYWNPEVSTDSTGTAKISFYNSDLNGKALIRVCGVSVQAHDACSVGTAYMSR